MEYQEIGKFKLLQRADFVSRMQLKYLNQNGNYVLTQQTSDEVKGQDYFMDPSDFGVPDGSIMWLYLWVKAGVDITATRAFIYKRGGSLTAQYTCTGTGFASHLTLDKVS